MKLLSFITFSIVVLIAIGGCSDHDKRLAELNQQIEQLELEIENARGPDDRLFEIDNQREVEETESVIELEGFVYRQKYPHTGDYFEFEYTIELKITNTSKEDIQFDSLNLNLVPINSTGIMLVLRASEIREGFGPRFSRKHIVGEKWVLPPGESEKMHIRTGAHYRDLIKHSFDLPLLLRVSLQDNKQVLVEYTTALPQLEGLPELARDHDGTFVATGIKLNLVRMRRFIAPEGSPRIY